MNRGAAALHRLSIGVIGLLCLLLAAGVILHQLSVHPVEGWVDRIDTGGIRDATAAGWFAAVLVAVALLALYWGWRLIRTTIAPRRPELLMLNGSGPEGTMTVSLKQVASAVEEQLATQTVLRQVRVQAIDDRGEAIIRITVDVAPERSYDEIVGIVTPTIEDLRIALGDSDVHVQVFIHLDALQ